jgi:hypothetical protein
MQSILWMGDAHNVWMDNWAVIDAGFDVVDDGPRSRFEAWTNQDMARCCINRHGGFVGCVFADASARKVGLKELWTLKWHKTFDTAGPWTLAGGVTASDWPDWIVRFKDY